MSFRKYFIEYVLLPYHTAAKKFCPRNSFAYKLFILLNLIDRPAIPSGSFYVK